MPNYHSSQEPKEMMRDGPFKSALVGLTIALCSGSFGFGISQATLATEVKLHALAINQIQKDVQQEKDNSERRMERVTSLVESMFRQNQDFINLLKVQNELLSKTIK